MKPMKPILFFSIFMLGSLGLSACKKIRTELSTPKIIGGNNVEDAQRYSFYADIEIDTESTGYKLAKRCGGVFIHERIVLTAAHCVRSLDKGFLYKTIVRPLDGQSGKIYDSPQIRVIGQAVHEEFPGDKILLENDIAVLFLEDWKAKNPGIAVRPIDMNDNVAFGLKIADQIPQAFSVGRGLITSIGAVFSEELQTAQVPIAPYDRCKSDPEFKGKGERLSGKILCSMTDSMDGLGSCSGDSGAPVFIYVEKKPLLIGIHSGSSDKGCAQKNSLSIMTHIAHFLPWIRERIRHFQLNMDAGQAFDFKSLVMAQCQDSLREEFSDEGRVLDSFHSVSEYFPEFLEKGIDSQKSNTPMIAANRHCKVQASGDFEFRFETKDPQPADSYHQSSIQVQDVKSGHVSQFAAIKQTNIEFLCINDSYLSAFIRYYPFGAGTYPGGFDASFYAEGKLDINSQAYEVTKKVTDKNVENIKWSTSCTYNQSKVEFGRASNETYAYVRISNHNLPTAAFELSLFQPKTAPIFQVTVEKKNATTGNLIIKNLSSRDLFTWELDCPMEMALKFPSGKIVSSIKEKNNEIESVDPSTAGFQDIIRTIPGLDIQSSTKFLFKHPRDEGSSIKSREELLLEYTLASDPETPNLALEKGFNHCTINREKPTAIFK